MSDGGGMSQQSHFESLRASAGMSGGMDSGAGGEYNANYDVFVGPASAFDEWLKKNDIDGLISHDGMDIKGMLDKSGMISAMLFKMETGSLAMDIKVFTAPPLSPGGVSPVSAQSFLATNFNKEVSSSLGG